MFMKMKILLFIRTIDILIRRTTNAGFTDLESLYRKNRESINTTSKSGRALELSRGIDGVRKNQRKHSPLQGSRQFQV